MSLSAAPPIWASRSKDDSEVVGTASVSFRRYGVKRVRAPQRGGVRTRRTAPRLAPASSRARRRPAPPAFAMQVSTLKLLPSRVVSRLYGAVNNLTL